jgi:hypothetical protein
MRCRGETASQAGQDRSKHTGPGEIMVATNHPSQWASVQQQHALHASRRTSEDRTGCPQLYPRHVQHINTSTHQHINTSTHQHINTSTHQHINTSTHQHINTSTHQQILLHSVISNIPKSGTVNEKGERTRDATSAISNPATKKPTATIQGQPTKTAHTLSATFN